MSKKTKWKIFFGTLIVYSLCLGTMLLSGAK